MPITYTFDLPFFTRYEREFKVSAMLQLTILLLGAITLDEGELLQFFLLADLAYWCAVAIIMYRRNGDATPVDRFLLKWGYPLMIPLVGTLLAILPHGLLRH